MRCAATAAVLGFLAAAEAAAQDEGTRVRCGGQRVTDIQVRADPPFVGTERAWWQKPIRVLNSLHSTTDLSVILGYIILEPGDICSERQRAESERILRAQPFLASASVATVSDGAGGVRLVVETRDEVSTVLSVSARGAMLTGLTFGNRNLRGSATYGAIRWQKGEFRDTYGVHIVDHQFMGRRYVADLSAARRDIGRSDWSADIAHPFLTDTQRVAWRTTMSEREDVFPFYRGSNADPADVAVRRTFLDVGGVVRIGVPGRLSLFGVSFSRETDRAGVPPAIRDTTVDYGELLAPFGARQNARINALWGLRNITYRRVERFDALNAAQDVRLGFQAGTLFGRSLSVLGAGDDDILVAADLYAGIGGGRRTFVSLNVRGEGRQNYDTNRWDGILGSGHLAYYQRIRDNHTVVTNVDWSGGWRQRIPFQLTLGDGRGGVRGYRRTRDAGGRRAVARLEDRWYLGDVRGQADLGLSFFADAGRLWAGDVLYGVDTPVRLGAGIGLLGSVPRGSKRTWRVDVAFPLSADGRAKWEVRLTTLNANRSYWREPHDMARSGEQSVPGNIF